MLNILIKIDIFYTFSQFSKEDICIFLQTFHFPNNCCQVSFLLMMKKENLPFLKTY